MKIEPGDALIWRSTWIVGNEFGHSGWHIQLVLGVEDIAPFQPLRITWLRYNSNHHSENNIFTQDLNRNSVTLMLNRNCTFVKGTGAEP